MMLQSKNHLGPNSWTGNQLERQFVVVDLDESKSSPNPNLNPSTAIHPIKGEEVEYHDPNCNEIPHKMLGR